MSLFWIIYGILGLFGIQKIPRRYINTEYEKPYKRFQGFVFLLMGVPCFIIWLLAKNTIIAPEKLPVIIVVCVMPSILYAFIGDMRFRKRLGRKTGIGSEERNK